MLSKKLFDFLILFVYIFNTTASKFYASLNKASDSMNFGSYKKTPEKLYFEYINNPNLLTIKEVKTFLKPIQVSK